MRSMRELEGLEDKKISPLYRLIRRIVWLVSPKYTLLGREKLPDGPCIIVGNHCHMYGPIAGELYTPGSHYTWCIGEMLHRREVAEYAYRDFWSGKPRSVRWFYRLLSRVIGPLSELVFTNAHTIGVYHDARLMTTFRETVEKLREGARVVIFPECYTRHNNIVYAFQDKFIDSARFYAKRTGETLSFVPLYLAPALGTMTFGDPIPFDPQAPIGKERERICSALMDAVTALAAAQPEHLVVPYPNMPKKRYPRSLPIEEYAHEEETR